MKKHYKAYVAGFDGAKELRIQLMEAQSYNEIKERTMNWLALNPQAQEIMISC